MRATYRILSILGLTLISSCMMQPLDKGQIKKPLSTSEAFEKRVELDGNIVSVTGYLRLGYFKKRLFLSGMTETERKRNCRDRKCVPSIWMRRKSIRGVNLDQFVGKKVIVKGVFRHGYSRFINIHDPDDAFRVYNGPFEKVISIDLAVK